MGINCAGSAISPTQLWLSYATVHCFQKFLIDGEWTLTFILKG